ncbi:MAG: hypothetical protein LBJ11_08955 [Oscillospiraceae bacterium]|jgi:hypothetical protein|nr:hypothetical protein [Oscillospiraceae bacterium]
MTESEYWLNRNLNSYLPLMKVLAEQPSTDWCIHPAVKGFAFALRDGNTRIAKQKNQAWYIECKPLDRFTPEKIASMTVLDGYERPHDRETRKTKKGATP